MLPTQGTLIAALITFAFLGVGAIALIALLGARNSRDDRPVAQDSALDAIEKAIDVHKEHVFLQRHPEWAGRDFRSDRNSPWYTEAEDDAKDSIFRPRADARRL